MTTEELAGVRGRAAAVDIVGGFYRKDVTWLLELVDKLQRHVVFRDEIIEAHKTVATRLQERVRELEAELEIPKGKLESEEEG